MVTCPGEPVLELERCVLAVLGSWIPNEGSDSDFLRVL